ncbi:hypothetical protein FNF31_04654 [Cafeteria roenbergensis]|uniref:Uncharacterized protein n=1 Tax=Cafeteria roenbergensis TaxID=33653 RepID=A0A5A8D303_CAFRO|nr:hypothetical protein FNF31_04654 [Cafeteria roenbergensis]
MDIRRQHPFGILGPVQYDFLPLNGATATEFAAEAAFASSPAQKRAETSSAWSQRFVAATNMTLLFYWSSPGDSTPRGVFPLFHETTVEYMRSFEGKDHVVIVRPRPSVPSCRVVYLSLPSEGQARRLAQRLMECRPEVLSLAAEMARSSATTVKREMETAQELERARDELLAAVQSALERATGAAELVLDLEHRVEAAWQAHGSLALEDGASVDGGGSRGGGSSAGKPPKLAPLQRHAGGEIHGLGEAVSAGEALRAGAALAAPSGAGTAAAGPAAAAAPGAATAAKSAAKPATASRRVFAELEARVRSAAAATNRLRDVAERSEERFRRLARVNAMLQLGPSAVQPAGWAYMTASAFSRELRTPPLQAYLDPETKRSCRLDARGPRGGYVALSFVVDRALADEGSNLEIRLAAQRAFRADVTVGACAVSLWQLQQWPGKAHAVWVELQSPDAALKPKPYEIPVPVGRDPAFPQRAALGELPPPPVTGRPCVLLQLVYTLTPPGEGGKLPRVEFFDSARARREQEEARKQVEAMSRGQASRGHGAEEIVFSRGKDSPKTDGPTPAAAAAPTGAGAAASQPAAAASATPKQTAAVSADRAAADAAAAAKLEAALAAAAAAEERAASAEQRASQAEEELAVVKHKLVRLAKAVQHSRAQQKAQTAASPASHKDSP